MSLLGAKLLHRGFTYAATISEFKSCRAVLDLMPCWFSLAIMLWIGAQPAISVRASEPPTQSTRPINVVLIVADDQGYGDLSITGAQSFQTPNLDRLAHEGTRFSSFYVSQAVCGASRASMLTGCYANRLGWLGAPGPASNQGLHTDETTIADLLKAAGYSTALFGKWHLGHLTPFLPHSQGFDEYYGLPYSNDMWPHHPTTDAFPDLPLISGTTIIDPAVDAYEQTRLTESYTAHAIDFIQRHRDDPFFLVVTHAMPHVPLFPAPAFVGSSEQGTYGDVIQEIDASVGRIMQTLTEQGLDDRTLVIYTSDNGPWLSYGNHAGSAGPLREGKGTAWEGGVRVPCLMRLPGAIPAGQVLDEWGATIDLLPTIAAVTQQPLPEKKIDGQNLWPLITHATRESPHQTYHYYYGTELRAIRHQNWKLVFPHKYQTLVTPGADGQPGPYRLQECGLELYDLATDLGEANDVAAAHPEIVAELQNLAQPMRLQLGDSLSGIEGNEIRPPLVWKP